MSEFVIGLDIGGANLKAATCEGSARAVAFELWKYPERLGTALIELLHGWGADRLAVTMTGELCDCFLNKRDGVSRILAQVAQAFPKTPVAVWSTEGRFVTPAAARQYPLRVASANWHALATWVAAWEPRNEPKLLIDIGSTTTDILPLKNGLPCPVGLTDFDRLQSGELIYTGVRRTPVCSLCRDGVMAEFFATTHDAYLLLGKASEDCGDLLTADGRPATTTYAHARLARMLGGDDEGITAEQTYQLAKTIHARQLSLIGVAIRTLRRGPLATMPTAVYVSGSGEWLAREAWKQLHADAVPIISLAEKLGPTASTAACAYAVARLANERSSQSKTSVEA